MSEFLIITGMSGAGRSTAADTFEDGGWFVIDNMPPALIGKVAELVARQAQKPGTPVKAAVRTAKGATSAAAAASTSAPATAPDGSAPGAPANASAPAPGAPAPDGSAPDARAPAPGASAPTATPAPGAPAPDAPALAGTGAGAAVDADRIALVVGRGGPSVGPDPESIETLTVEIEGLRKAGHQVRILFLDAADDVLVRRFEGTRRRHPLPAESVSEAVNQERRLLEPIKSMADVVVDTSELNVHQLRGRLIDLFERNDPTVGMQTTVVSFGYKHGIPLDVDLVFDCRFLPNPHWVDELRPQTGLDEPVQEYVLAQPETGEFLDRLDGLLELLLPAYVKEGKAYLTIAVGCTGGRHRSVVLAEQVAHLIEKHGFSPTLLHRDVQR